VIDLNLLELIVECNSLYNISVINGAQLSFGLQEIGKDTTSFQHDSCRLKKLRKVLHHSKVRHQTRAHLRF
jgi:hypothetical protein